MSSISKFSPDNGQTQYDIKDASAQTKTLETPLTISGKEYSTVEEALTALASLNGAYVEGTTLHIS